MTYTLTVETETATGTTVKVHQNVPETELQDVRADERWLAPRGAVQRFTETPNR
jgi:hypothetical protein